MCDQSIILHEMIHHYQKNSKRSFDLDQRTLTLQERQALYYQNLFLISQKRKNNNKDLKTFYNVKVVLT